MGGKTSPNPSGVVSPATAVVSGSFLAGAMMGLSLIAIPVLVDTNSDPAHLVRQWARLYGYGIQYMPAGAIATTALYVYSAATHIRSHHPWLNYAVAAAATMSIVPFTWFVMAPTNNLLFGLNEVAGGARDLAEVHGLIVTWRWLHVIRSLFPLVGGLYGLRGAREELGL